VFLLLHPQELVPELSAAVEKVGLKWSDFTITDNSCKPHPPQKSIIQVTSPYSTTLESTCKELLHTDVSRNELNNCSAIWQQATSILTALCLCFLCWQEIESEAEVLEKGLEKGARVLEQGIEKEAGIVEQGLETSLESGLRSFGKGFTVLEKDIASLEAQLEKGLSAVSVGG
jgi:violaxanthin de-epoxidase